MSPCHSFLGEKTPPAKKAGRPGVPLWKGAVISVDDIINRLIDIDRQATQIVKKAEEHLQASRQGITKERQAVQETYDAQAQRRLEKIRAQEQRLVKENEKAIAQTYQAKREKLQKAYESGHIQWETQIFNRCIGR